MVCVLAVLLLSYVRAVLFDVFQSQGDLIVGTETLPVILGEARAITIIKWLLAVAAVIFVAAPIYGLMDYFGFLMLLPIACLSICIFAYERRRVYPGPNIEAMVDCSFLIAGLLGVLWHISQSLK